MNTYKDSTVPTFAAIFVGSKNEYPALVRGGYFASSKWLETGSHDGVMGESFGWYCPTDKEEYRNSKYSFRPMTEEEWDKHKSLECFQSLIEIEDSVQTKILEKLGLDSKWYLSRVYLVDTVDHNGFKSQITLRKGSDMKIFNLDSLSISMDEIELLKNEETRWVDHTDMKNPLGLWFKLDWFNVTVHTDHPLAYKLPLFLEGFTGSYSSTDDICYKIGAVDENKIISSDIIKEAVLKAANEMCITFNL
jgi:hypothetical protein